MSDKEDKILQVVLTERDASIGYRDELSAKRATLLDYYNGEPYGDEVDGQSSYVSTDVSDVVEGMLPSMLRVFTQGRYVGRFNSETAEQEEEANQKTELVNHIFLRQNQGVLTLHNAFKDALLQYVGVVKVYWDEAKTATKERYSGLSQAELTALEADPEVRIDEVNEGEQELVTDAEGEVVMGKVFAVKATRIKVNGQVKYENIPSEEFLLSKEARDFVKPRFIGQKTRKRRSELIEMDFDKDIVAGLPAWNAEDTEESYNRNKDIENGVDGNPTADSSNDEIWITEGYVFMDLDGDGVSEYYQVFEAGNKLLEYNAIDDHPFACGTPVPMPHRAIGTCPAEQTADLQFTKSVLVRQMLNNMYQTNYSRIAYNSDVVDLDDLLTLRAGGAIGVEGGVSDALMPIVTQPQIQSILGGIEYMDTARETRTGLTRHTQGLNPDTLHDTASGFNGMRDDAMLRQELITRVLGETLVKSILVKTARLITHYQDDAMQIKVTGHVMDIDPSVWRYDLDCYIELGGGDRQEKIQNLNYILQLQSSFMQTGSVLADQAKVYHTLDRIITETGLKSVDTYFNNPELPEDVAQATVEILTKQVEQLTQMTQQNPLAEAEMVRAQASLVEAQGKGNIEMAKEGSKMHQFMAKLDQSDRQYFAGLVKDYTKLELDGNKDIDGNGQVGNVEQNFRYDPASGKLALA